MAMIVRRTRAALHHLNPNQRFLQRARLVVEIDGQTFIETFWSNKEVYGLWLLRWPVLQKCFRQLKRQGLIEPDLEEPSEKTTFKLSPKGAERLRI